MDAVADGGVSIDLMVKKLSNLGEQRVYDGLSPGVKSRLMSPS
jgi:hypothetical protein